MPMALLLSMTGKRSCFEEGGQLPVVVGHRTKEQEGQR